MSFWDLCQIREFSGASLPSPFGFFECSAPLMLPIHNLTMLERLTPHRTPAMRYFVAWCFKCRTYQCILAISSPNVPIPSAPFTLSSQALRLKRRNVLAYQEIVDYSAQATMTQYSRMTYPRTPRAQFLVAAHTRRALHVYITVFQINFGTLPTRRCAIKVALPRECMAQHAVVPGLLHNASLVLETF